ncbi:keratin, type I cytoskeletal 14-like [Thalassophryne amazonica]|uniref:keratin, type I cytoskeletal 14-like n=1 Tax=Thalassophryne amazonica TaxID=390379 RepID=UPI001471457C|nr:keratin, type I cytoskeletal 14-like [Thalassophryne amazonica]
MSRSVRVWGAGGGRSPTGSLMERLSVYVGRKRQLERHNQELEEEITEILTRRETPEERDWEEVQKPLDGLRTKVREVTLENNKLLLQVDSIKQATADLKTKLEVEQQVQWMIEQDLVGLKKNIDEIKLNRSHLHKQIEFVKEETLHFKKEHKHEVDKLHEKIKDFHVKVEVDSQDSGLNKTHVQCDRLVKKNMKEGDDWYQKKLDTIKAEVAQNTEALQFGQMELNSLLRDKRHVEIMIRAKLSTICFLEEKLKDVKGEYNHKLVQANQIILGLEGELKQVRMQMDYRMNDYHLLNDTMMLEKGISSYQELMQGITTDTNSSQLASEALHSGQHKSDHKVTQEEVPTEEENT